MLKFQMTISDRKILVKRIGELTGAKPRYTYVPRCAYEIGLFTVEKNGDLMVTEENEDTTIIQTLQSEGMIGKREVVEAPARPIVVHAPTPRSRMELPPPVASCVEVVTVTEEEADEEEPVIPHWVIPAQEEAAQMPQTEEAALVSELPLAAEAGIEDASENDVSQPTLMSDPELADTNEQTIAVPASGFPMDAKISIPLGRHTGQTIRNLVNLLYSRGPLLSKATGGAFLIDDDLVTALEEANLITAKDAVNCIAAYEQTNDTGMLGLKISGEAITFDGFVEVPDAQHLQTFQKLAVLMNKMALTQKRIQAKEIDSSNEKYALRVWLIRLGMNGDAYKADRKLLMENLSGHTAFRTQESQERAKRKAQKQKEQIV
jgi:hypothetical protein